MEETQKKGSAYAAILAAAALAGLVYLVVRKGDQPENCSEKRKAAVK